MAGAGIVDRGDRRGRKRTAFGGMFIDDGFARFAKVTILLSAAAVLVMGQDFMAKRGMMKFEYPHSGGAVRRGHDDDGERRRPDGALHGAGTAIAVTLRGGGNAAGQRPLDRGRSEVFRAGRAQLGHAALWRVADLWLCRHDAVLGHHRGGGRRSCLDRAASGPDLRDDRDGLQGERGAVPHVDAGCLRRLAHTGHRLLCHRPEDGGDGAICPGAA